MVEKENELRPRMLTHSEIPKLLKRTHIVKGYRPLNQPITYYCKSAFCTHNELINIWSHLVPAICLIVFYVLPELFSASPRLPVLVLYAGVGSLLFASSLAHLLHSRSPHDHIFWFLVDFAGIALFGCSIGLQRYSCGSDMSLIGHMAYLPSLMLIVLVLQFLSSCYLFVSQPEWPWRLELRMATCFLLAIWVYVPLVDRYLSENSAADSSLVLHTNAFNWLMVSGVFMGAKVPERFAPGRFDIFGYGHQLFHLCVNMVAWNLCDAAHLDCAPIAWNSPSNVAISAAFLMSAVFTACTVRTLSKKSLDIKYD
ncbi:Membrane progestin receptor alpha-B [Trichostrongylus colubriformis]|uniref:Membrane progestin receptor alpha-B n=1 Tax=Trichostrongylus colubriformis TaxID=6319 RepID=A0AAN8FBW5_TRICO